MNKSLVKYLVPVAFFGVFLGTIFIWSMAIGPAKVKKQMVICYKFNTGISQESIDKHMTDFKMLKVKSAEIVNYSAGYTSKSDVDTQQYDVMHYLTFKTEEDITNFKNSIEFKNFKKSHEGDWNSQLIVNAEIK